MSPCRGSAYRRWQQDMFALSLMVLALFASQSFAQSNPPASLALDGELLLDVRLDGRSLDFSILGYRDESRFWLSLAELMDVLQFPVNVDAGAGRAGGWYIREERSFSLDLAAGKVSSGEQVFEIGGQAVIFQGDLFVTMAALERWFPIVLAPLIRQLQLDVSTTETIPLQARLSRSRSERVSGASGLSREPQLPYQQTPYRATGPHATDIRLNTSSVLEDEDDTSTSLGGSYSILSRGDLAWMTSTIALSGSKDDDISDGRFKLERSDLDGPMKLEHVEVGDVDASSRGLLIRGGGAQEGETGLFADEQVDLRGDVPPNWEVELYRNGVLIDFQVVGGAAQYEFLDVPLEFGENRFEFVLYGPFGEERREELVRFAGRSALELGDVSYELAAVQDGRSVLDVRSPSPKGQVDTGRFLSNFNIGLATNAVASVGVDSFVANDNREQDYSASLSVNFATFQANVGYRNRALAQDEATGLIRARLNASTTTSMRYTQFFKGGLDEELVSTDRQRWNGNVNLFTRVASLPLNVDAFHQQREQSSASSASAGTTFTNSLGVRFSKSFFYDRDDQAGSVDERTGGSINVSTSMRPWSFRTGIGYGISPDSEINNVNASANLRVDSRMRLNFDVNHSAQTDFTTYRAGFNWLLDSLQISPQVIYDSNERWVGLVSVSTSFSPRPDRVWPEIERLSQTQSGGAYAKAYLDNNGNGVMDQGEEGVEGVRIEAVQSWRSAETEADGRAYINRLRAERVTDIAIDSSSLTDIELRPVAPGVSIRPRPGSWSRIDFPVIRTMELEGYVRTHIQGADDDLEPVERAQIQLLRENGQFVATQRTAFDGFFLFSAVPPGVYELRLGDQWSSRVEEKPRMMSVNANGGVIQDLDFVLAMPEGRQLIESAPRGVSPEPPVSPGFAPFPVERPSTLPEPESALSPTSEVDLPSEPSGRVSSGNWYVQVGVFGEPSNARNYWQQLLGNEVLSGTLEPKFVPVGNLTGLLAGPGQSETQARTLCSRIKSEGVDCLVREVND